MYVWSIDLFVYQFPHTQPCILEHVMKSQRLFVYEIVVIPQKFSLVNLLKASQGWLRTIYTVQMCCICVLVCNWPWSYKYVWYIYVYLQLRLSRFEWDKGHTDFVQGCTPGVSWLSIFTLNSISSTFTNTFKALCFAGKISPIIPSHRIHVYLPITFTKQINYSCR